MAINELTAVIPVPATPAERGRKNLWKSVQASLGISLPGDFRDFGCSYGSGMFRFRNTELTVFNAFSPSGLESIRTHTIILEASGIELGPHRFPYRVYPETPGLLVWGSDVDGNELCWLTSGAPRNWSIVLRSHDGEFEMFPGPLTSFLAQVFRGELKTKTWPATHFDDLHEARFEPRQPPPAFERMSIYELYIANGNRAGFWAKTPGSTRQVLFVKTINGKTEGPLPGFPMFYDNAQVIVDSYSTGNVSPSSSNITLGNPSNFAYVLAEPPAAS